MESGGGEQQNVERQPGDAKERNAGSGEAASEPRRGPKSCSSHFKGVTKHRRTGRFEAHIWGRAANKGPGKQIYLGGFVTPEEAAEAHDLAALQLQGSAAKTNFHVSRYEGWLATLQAAPPGDDLALQLRQAGRFKRSIDKKLPEGRPEAGLQRAPQRKREREPPTPFKLEAKARTSRVSDSTQSADTGPSNGRAAAREDSVTSQACKRAKGQAPGAGRAAAPTSGGPLPPVLPSGARAAAEGANGPPSRGEEPVPGVPAQTFMGFPVGTIPGLPFLPGGLPLPLDGGGQTGPGAGMGPLPPQAVASMNPYIPPLTPLGWENLELLARAQAQTAQPPLSAPPVAAPTAPAPAPPSSSAPPQQPATSSTPQQAAASSAPAAVAVPTLKPPAQGLQTAALQLPFAPQMPGSEPGTWMSPSGDGGIVYGHSNFIGFLTPDQVRWLEASGVKFPQQLHSPANQPPTSESFNQATGSCPPPSGQQLYPRLQIDQLQASASLSHQPLPTSFAPLLPPTLPRAPVEPTPAPAPMDGAPRPQAPEAPPVATSEAVEPHQGAAAVEKEGTLNPNTPSGPGSDVSHPPEGGSKDAKRERSANAQQIAEALLVLKATNSE